MSIPSQKPSLSPKVLLILAIIALALSFPLLRSTGVIGILRAESLEEDARASQKIDPQWLCASGTGGQLAAMVFSPPDRSDHTFSVYWERPGLSLGYFFRGGGSVSAIDQGIACFSIENCPQKAYLSLNRPGIAQVTVDDGVFPRTIPLDPEEPFALVFSQKEGSITFLDREGRAVEPQLLPL